MIKLFKKIFGLCEEKGCFNTGCVEVRGKKEGNYCMLHYNKSRNRRFKGGN